LGMIKLERLAPHHRAFSRAGVTGTRRSRPSCGKVSLDADHRGVRSPFRLRHDALVR
jgi:hypothetical protein